ncbi:hemoglobin/transferrin/lactoferrin receptor protein [Roseospira marina]|nr:hemoglobin/transferrin/lactoferrin receptor protein [Roseospira marina]MBB5087319.1 hemoglobin/transferrin/lactoferrin receptor protein [Roseospira marina]
MTATRTEIDPFTYPGMVTVIDRQRVQDLNASTPDDLLKMVPNVQFSGGPRRTGEVPSIRGFSGDDIVILIDGARQNFGSGHDGRFFLDPALLKGVEVLRGPASSLYGSGGTGGVIEFRTVEVDDFLEPGQTFGFTSSLGGQTVNDEWLVTTTAYGRPMDGVDLLGSVARRRSGEIELGDGSTLTDSDDSIVSGLVKGGVDLTDHHRLEVSFSHFSNDAEEPNNAQGRGGEDLVDKEIATDNARVAYSYRNPDNDWVDLDVVAYYTRFKADELRLDDLGAGPEGERLTRDVETIGARIDNRTRFRLAEQSRVILTYGAEAYRDEQEGESASGDREGVPNADGTFAGLYGQAQVVLVEPLSLPGEVHVIPGLRFDHYDFSSDVASTDTTENRLSPRIGLTYKPVPWFMVFGNYAEAFRAPTFNEMYLTGTHFEMAGLGIVNRFVPNPDLKPQTTRTVEFGAGLDFKDILFERDRFDVKVSHFHMWGDDFIDLAVNQPAPFADCNPFRPGACDGTTTSTNVPNAELWGTEIEGNYENDRIRLGLGFSSIDGENTDTGEKLGMLTPTRVTLDTGLKVPEIDSLIGWRMTVAGRFDKVNDPAEKRDAYDVHDVYAVYQPSDGVLKGLRVDLGIDNAFDEDYSRVYTGASESGRNFKALVSYSMAW